MYFLFGFCIWIRAILIIIAIFMPFWSINCFSGHRFLFGLLALALLASTSFTSWRLFMDFTFFRKRCYWTGITCISLLWFSLLFVFYPSIFFHFSFRIRKAIIIFLCFLFSMILFKLGFFLCLFHIWRLSTLFLRKILLLFQARFTWFGCFLYLICISLSPLLASFVSFSFSFLIIVLNFCILNGFSSVLNALFLFFYILVMDFILWVIIVAFCFIGDLSWLFRELVDRFLVLFEAV